MLQLLRSLIGVNKTAEELDEVLPASTHEELGRLCERLADQTFKKQLKCYLISLGGRNVGDTVRRMLRKIGTNFLWGGYSLKGKKGKIAFIDLPVARVIITTACKENEAQQEFSVLVTLGHRGLRRISVMITFEQCMEKCSPM
ncbi:hypothetical protein NP493_336g00020 [Ridgeia piscesae]|uniref:DUF4806 domain-containing protein n=1 Tax=Ridgeia piscesae TaxID=27915 RepID=A0AAD9L5A9_RIDPI|nr:hypothetical protein NP493_336g00020 [Ridgeia piscesae]